MAILALRLGFGTISSCALILFFSSVRPGTLPEDATASQSELRSEQRLDQSLYQTAATALGSRDGTVIVIDPQSGRIRVVVNPELASESAFAPGSTIKAFTLLAALRSETIRYQPRILCREHYSNEEFETTCSHPKDLPPFGPAEAIAYSCNYYFGKVGEQLNLRSFNSTLAEFGFGERTGVDWLEGERESVGRLAGAPWRSQNALGEGNQIQVTPLQLLTAYSALVNGGHLFKPHTAEAKDLVLQSRRDIRIDNSERSLIVEGMRGAVRYGTAERASLYSLPAYIFGKTGTSTEIDGFRTQGWFVGFASSSTDNSRHLSKEPKGVKLGVLVFLKRANGADAARLARPIFEAFVRAVQLEDSEREGRGDAETGGREDSETRGHEERETGRYGVGLGALPSSISESPRLRVPGSPCPRVPAYPRLRVSASEVRVHLVRENMTLTMPLEDYVLGVVASEGSTETEPEALKALAVASRTYALKNERRHLGEGYDFCSTTHCQRYRLVNLATANTQTSSAIHVAVKQTTGEILHDSEGQIVDSYFGASCGGATANIHTLWGARGQDYLKGERDEYCQTEPHHSWVDVISAADLLRALQSDRRTNVGDRLTNIRVVRHDTSGRAELIALDGLGRRTVSGWDFKIIVGRALGWNLLKSSRFEISRFGSNYVFRGSGFGHGLGLCQEGAHVMALRGHSYQQILTKYFPTTHVEREKCKAAGDFREPRADWGPQRGVPSSAALLGWQTGSPAESVWEKASLCSPFLRGCNLSKQFQHGDTAQLLAPTKKKRSTKFHEETQKAIRVSSRDFVDRCFLSKPCSRNKNLRTCITEFTWRNSIFPTDFAAVVASGSKRAREIFQADLIWNVAGYNEGASASAHSYHGSRMTRRSLTSEHFRLNFPGEVSQRDAGDVLRALESSRGDLVRRVSATGVAFKFPALEIFINQTTGDFVGRTGQPPWAAAATRGNRVELQPLELLKRRRILETTLRHELVHVVITEMSQGQTPRWLAEGLAIHFAGEGQTVSRYMHKTKISIAELENRLWEFSSAEDMRAVYAAAYREVRRLIADEGEAAVWRRVAGRD